MEDRITILDGYTDEPSCLGVPPVLAPLPRYVYGAIRDANKDARINYITIGEFRLRGKSKSEIIKNKIKLMNDSKLLIVIAGAIVPGKYLHGTPISIREVIEIGQQFQCTKLLGGAAIKYGFQANNQSSSNKQINTLRFSKIKAWNDLKNFFDYISFSDLDAAVHDLILYPDPGQRTREIKEWQKWALAGAEIVKQHPDFPSQLLLELEAGHGCARYFNGGCSFCSEPLIGEPTFRKPEEIREEVALLYKFGVQNFRLGALSCLFSYFAQDISKTETPTPNPKQVERLLRGIRSSAPGLHVLHLDNANPSIMAAHIAETKAILKTIIETCTAGNVLSFGLESADEKVIKSNNLNTNPIETEKMIKLVNQYGSDRGDNGMPKLLPGLNFVYGLRGESKDTFRQNFEFLRSILDQDLLLRRINLRQVQISSGRLANEFNTKKFHKEFIKHKKMVRENIDRPMLERLVPKGSVLKNVFIEKLNGNISFGRQCGTYPVLIGIPYKLELNEQIDVYITEHGYRSITGFKVPFSINSASQRELQSLPGVGTKRANRMILARPFKSAAALKRSIDDDQILDEYVKHLKFN
jgi:radical SAM superfamily enzyme with C-terminal helix-hairpin-helix motif